MEEKYTLKDLYSTLDSFKNNLNSNVSGQGLIFASEYTLSPLSTLIANTIYNYYYDDYLKYYGVSAKVNLEFMSRISYDIAVKFPYWKTKYNYILKLFTPDQLNLLQTSRMISESHEDVKSAGGVIQKSANTPTGVSATPTGDNLEITTTPSSTPTSETLEVDVGSDSFADKYTNYQGKTATGSKTQGDRSGDVMREGSIKELLEVLEKLPSSFTDEILKEVSKHFEVVYSY